MGKMETYEKAGKTIVIRPMLPEDVEAVSRLEEETFSMPWSKEAFSSMLERADSLYVTAIADGKVVGCCGIINACGDGDVCNVVVDKNIRRMGVGRRMMSALMLWSAQDLGVVNYTLEVRVGNRAAIAMYESLGFVSEGVRPRFYEKPTEDALIMWKRAETDG